MFRRTSAVDGSALKAPPVSKWPSSPRRRVLQGAQNVFPSHWVFGGWRNVVTIKFSFTTLVHVARAFLTPTREFPPPLFSLFATAYSNRSRPRGVGQPPLLRVRQKLIAADKIATTLVPRLLDVHIHGAWRSLRHGAPRRTHSVSRIVLQSPPTARPRSSPPLLTRSPAPIHLRARRHPPAPLPPASVRPTTRAESSAFILKPLHHLSPPRRPPAIH